MSPNPRTDPYAAQLQSPLFRLPRELRDEIYAHYTFEENGYFHQIDTGKLYLADRQPIDLRLMYTCRAVAAEMKGAALRTNTVTFQTGDIEDELGYYGLRSRAGRYNMLQARVTTTRLQMLIYAAPCVTPQVLQSLVITCGESGQYFVDALKAVQDGRRRVDYMDGTGLICELAMVGGIDFSVEHRQALKHLLELASVHADFDRLASLAFDRTTNNTRAWSTFFLHDAFKSVLTWQPCAWAIPTITELLSLENLLTEEPLNHIYGSCFSEDNNMCKWFFSATAIAISFFSQHPSETFHMRNVILEEVFKSVSNPEHHARGLIPHLGAYKGLRIERHVGLWTTLYPPGWNGILYHLIAEKEEGLIQTATRFEDILFSLVQWITEVRDAESSLLAKSFTLALGHDISEIWSLAHEAAMLGEAMHEYYNQRGVGTPSHGTHVDFQRVLFPLPCHVPRQFTYSVKAMIGGSSRLIRFNGFAGDRWDLSQILPQRAYWSASDWHMEWKALMERKIALPGGSAHALVERYKITRVVEDL
ncbi:uncharacterized protein K460DRAFT_359315 [Cucurbitaria berberidis CBS 394.84]|uniref:Uncharacterized protein n=1 Tax=Cucurbitaria berberidis CBS 394.84 TaxID=1168544 RepID=A0A9P4L3W7_9PLEO|nr:uncharacterized protein K460DRAFT_359315 [Cucurbitaria berberidis CBS 394.84]KAF1840739.1 hypothetical protein K460DRAFT_359315 [Cucurbitaria berberidis CBS 394.84]